jgi:hypothetical protein
MHSKSKSAVTTQEWLAVIGLVCVFALLSITLLYLANYRRHKVERNALWSEDAGQLMAIVFNQLKSYCQSQTNFPALTAEELHQRGVFDDRTLAFLKSPKVHYYPFSSSDPDTNVVLSVIGIWPDIRIGNRGWNGSTVPEEFTKGAILSTNPPARWLSLDAYR